MDTPLISVISPVYGCKDCLIKLYERLKDTITVSDKKLVKRTEIIRENGTNRSAFFRGEVDKYNWVYIGSSYLPSEITAAILFAQLEHLNQIQQKRIKLWNQYYELLLPLGEKGVFILPAIPDYATNNGHLFYILCNSSKERAGLSEYLKQNSILAVFHYLSLHKSPYYAGKYSGKDLPNSDRYSETLLRLPMFYELNEEEVKFVTSKIKDYFRI